MNSVDYYNENAKEFYRNTINLNMEELYVPFLELLPKRGHILDAGCGSGRDSLNFIKRGYKVTAFDASSELVKLSSALIGQRVLHLRFEDMKLENEFDGVWACASLLHLNKTKFKQVLTLLERSLTPNGVIYISLKFGNDNYGENGRYFYCYNHKSFRNALMNHYSLKILKLWKTKDVNLQKKTSWLNVLLNRV